jgi:chromosome segregation ATPase
MDEVEIYRMLQEATGIHKFEKRHENTLAELKKNEEQKEEIKVVLNDIEARLKAYEDRREEFEYYSYEQLANKARSKQDYE